MMKKILVVCALLLYLMISPCFAFQYCNDFLEPGNSGGSSESLKTFDDEWILNVGEEVELDVWINDVPGELFGAGFWITYDPSLVSIEDVLAYDNVDLPGPWSPFNHTFKLQDPEGPGTYLLVLLRTDGAPPDADGDILLGKVRFRCVGEGKAPITISVAPDSNLAMFIGYPSPTVYDDDVLPKTISLNQGNQAIPTLSEWGIIIFLTVIMGISVVMLYRRREI